jgi:hypothetical protein
LNWRGFDGFQDFVPDNLPPPLAILSERLRPKSSVADGKCQQSSFFEKKCEMK